MATLGTFVSGEVLTAAELNDIGTWTNFTPTWTNLTVGNATQSWYYSQLNDIIFITGVITLGTTSTMGTNPRFTLPNSYNAASEAMGVAQLNDSGTIYRGMCTASGTVFALWSTYTGGTWGTRGGITATAPFTWGNGDQLIANVTFRIA